MISRNEVFSRVATALRTYVTTKYSTSCYVTGERIYAPTSFPAIWLVEIDSAPSERYTDLTLTDEQRRSTFEIQVFSNKNTGATSQANDICEKAISEFRKLGYLCTMSQPFDNGADANIKRYVARVTRMIGGGDTLPPIE